MPFKKYPPFTRAANILVVEVHFIKTKLYCGYTVEWAYAKLFKQKEENVVHMDLTRSD